MVDGLRILGRGRCQGPAGQRRHGPRVSGSERARSPACPPFNLFLRSVVLLFVLLPVLTRVDIEGGIDDVTPIAEALTTNISVQSLYLDENEITSVQSLGPALEANTTLKKL